MMQHNTQLDRDAWNSFKKLVSALYTKRNPNDTLSKHRPDANFGVY